MDKEIQELKRRAGILTEGDVVPFSKASQTQPQPQVGNDLEERRIQLMAQLAEVLGEELAPIKHDKSAVKAHLKGVVNNLVEQVMFSFLDD